MSLLRGRVISPKICLLLKSLNPFAKLEFYYCFADISRLIPKLKVMYAFRTGLLKCMHLIIKFCSSEPLFNRIFTSMCIQLKIPLF